MENTKIVGNNKPAMKSVKKVELVQGYLIAISLVIIMTAAIFLCIFALTEEPSMRDVNAWKELRKTIN